MVNELFDLLAIHKKSINEILEDETDYRSLIRQTTSESDTRKRSTFISALTLRSLAKSVKRNLDEVFANLCIEEACHE